MTWPSQEKEAARAPSIKAGLAQNMNNGWILMHNLLLVLGPRSPPIHEGGETEATDVLRKAQLCSQCRLILYTFCGMSRRAVPQKVQMAVIGHHHQMPMVHRCTAKVLHKKAAISSLCGIRKCAAPASRTKSGRPSATRPARPPRGACTGPVALLAKA